MSQPSEGPSPPNVFLSHAGEDKDRFVLDFARKLRQRGIEAWVDRWEIYPGDSLIDKLFGEGLKNAHAVIVVISKASVTKKWVREELNAAMVKRINTGSMLLPVVIDDCEVPEALQSIVWQKISDLANYSDELDRIVASIFNYREKPPLGPPPSYVQERIPQIQGLQRTDVIVLKCFGDEVFESGDSISVDTEDIWNRVEPLGLPRREFEDSLRILAENYLVKEGQEAARFPTYFSSTVTGLEQYAQSFVSDYEAIKQRISSTLVNTDLNENEEIAEALQLTLIVVTHVFHELESRGMVRVEAAAGGHCWVTDISPRLKRELVAQAL